MGFLADALSRVKPSATIVMTQKARELKAQGRDVIRLVGRRAGFRHARQHQGGGDRGDPPRRDQVPAGLRHRAAARGDRQEVQARERPRLQAVADHRRHRRQAGHLQRPPGDAEPRRRGHRPARPTGSAIRRWSALCGGTPVFVETTMENGFKLQPEALERAITPKTKWLILNSPSNPSGAAYTRAELKALTDVLHAPSACLGADRRHVRAPRSTATSQFVTPAQVEPGLYERTLTMNGVSKAYAMTGWRIGYAAGPEQLIKAMDIVQGQQTSGACSIAQWAAVEALNGPQDHLAAFRKALRGAPRPRRLDAEPGARASSARRRKARSTSIRPAPRPIGKTAPSGKTHRDRRGLRHRAAGEPKASRWCTARPSASARTSASPTPPRTRCWRRPARRIQRFCGALR